MAEAEAHLGRHATDASHRRARLVRAYRLLRRDLVGKDEADVRPRRTPMTMGAAGGSMNPELIFEIATPLGFIAAAWIGPCTSSIGEVGLAGFALSRAARTGLAS